MLFRQYPCPYGTLLFCLGNRQLHLTWVTWLTNFLCCFLSMVSRWCYRTHNVDRCKVLFLMSGRNGTDLSPPPDAALMVLSGCFSWACNVCPIAFKASMQVNAPYLVHGVSHPVLFIDCSLWRSCTWFQFRC